MVWKIGKKTHAERVNCGKELKAASLTRASNMLEQYPLAVPHDSLAPAGNEPGFNFMSYREAYLEAEKNRGIAMEYLNRSKYRFV